MCHLFGPRPAPGFIFLSSFDITIMSFLGHIWKCSENVKCFLSSIWKCPDQSVMDCVLLIVQCLCAFYFFIKVFWPRNNFLAHIWKTQIKEWLHASLSSIWTQNGFQLYIPSVKADKTLAGWDAHFIHYGSWKYRAHLTLTRAFLVYNCCFVRLQIVCTALQLPSWPE